MPSFQRRITDALFSTLISKIQSKLSGWKEKILSLGAKIALIKSILLALPLYLLALIKPLKGTISGIHRIMSNFFWHDKDGFHKFHWIRWDSFCLPIEDGGLVLKISKIFQKHML